MSKRYECSICGVQGKTIDRITRWKLKQKGDKKATRYCLKCDNELIIINEISIKGVNNANN